MVRLNDHEKRLLDGAQGEPRRLAMEQLVQVADFFDAEDMVEVSQVHLMADTEATGEVGVAFVEEIARYPLDERRVVVPTVTDPRGADFKAYQRIRQSEEDVALERRAIDAFRALGIMMRGVRLSSPPLRRPAMESPWN